MQVLLGSLSPPLRVQPSLTHGRNDCFIDSILLELTYRGYLRAMDVHERDSVCRDVRQHFVRRHGVADRYPFLQHDIHFDPICQRLRTEWVTKWVLATSPAKIKLVAVVYDRFNRSRVIGVNNAFDEIAETEPVVSRPIAPVADTAVLLLYCNTNDDGEGWHYE